MKLNIISLIGTLIHYSSSEDRDPCSSVKNVSVEGHGQLAFMYTSVEQ